MRELIAKGVFILTMSVVLGLAGIFAVQHNPGVGNLVAAPAFTGSPASAKTPEVSATAIARGRTLFVEQACATCHSFEGEGNPRYPLDSVSERLKPAEVREWITGTGPAKEELPVSIAKKKQRYLKLTAEDLNALALYLLNPKPSPTAPK